MFFKKNLFLNLTYNKHKNTYSFIKNFFTRICCISCSVSAQHGMVMGSMLGCGIVAVGTWCSILGLELRLGSIIASSASMLSPYRVIAKDVKSDFWDWSFKKRKVCGVVPCYSQDGYRAQVLWHPIDSYRYTHTSNSPFTISINFVALTKCC